MDSANERVQELTGGATHVTTYTYDGNGNLATETDPLNNKTKYTYDADNELTKTETPNKAVTETEYDSKAKVARSMAINTRLANVATRSRRSLK